MMVLDISPTLSMYEQTSLEFAKGYWHWFFLIQKHPLPEKLINAEPEFFLDTFIGKNAGPNFAPEDWQTYIAQIKNPDSVHAMCEDYRAAITIDLEHDKEDRLAGKKIQIPLRVLWGDLGLVNRCFKPIEDWQAVATEVSGKTLAAGHYIPEHAPEELIADILEFFRV
jgi:haloacetate dehalogenase